MVKDSTYSTTSKSFTAAPAAGQFNPRDASKDYWGVITGEAVPVEGVVESYDSEE